MKSGLVLRARIIVPAADGVAHTEIARRYAISRQTLSATASHGHRHESTTVSLICSPTASWTNAPQFDELIHDLRAR